MTKRLMDTVATLLEPYDIRISGTRPWDIRVNDARFFVRVLREGSLGLGESYMDGWWECDQLDELIARLLRDDIRKQLKKHWPSLALGLASVLLNRQNKKRAFTIAKAHYDKGNDLYEAMLDKSMTYTCGYWKDVHSLDEAQEAKLDLVCRKIGLKPGQQVLDIGCGWGSFARFAAEKYGGRVTGITVSREQVALARERCKNLPVEIRLQDYRDVDEVFDHVISLGMIEHVGPKNYHHYMRVVSRCLKDDGCFLLHTIGSARSVQSTDPWIEKYIFPNSVLPSIAQLAKAVEGSFVIEDLHNFSADYDKTLMAWYANFVSAWPRLKETYGDRFFRMWSFYLLSCAGSFRSRSNQLWQFVCTKKGILGGYQSIR